jgi:hypothetical protein
MKVISIVIGCLISTSVSAQLIPNLGGQRAGTSAFTFLKFNASPRQVAMGGAQIAVAGDGFSTNSNPAAIVDVKEVTFALSNNMYVDGIQNNYLSVILPGKKYSNWGFHIQSLTTGAMEKRTEFQPGGTGEFFYANNLAAGVSYGKILSDYFSYGLNLKYVYEGIDNFSVHTGVIDLGFLYRTDFKDLRFAVMLNNFGVNTKIDGETKTFTSFNNSGNIESFSPPTLFKMGMSIIPVKSEKNSLLISAELHHPNDNSENIRIGAELDMRKLFFVRAGYKIGIKDQTLPTFGAGVKARVGRHALKIDYAADMHPYLGYLQYVGLQLALNKQSR